MAEFDTECFVIAPIGSPDSDERARSDGILAALIAPAARSVDLEPVRADQIGEPGQITLQVIDHLLHARAAVADLTGANANVFYELAIRHAARLPVALVAEQGERLPFDLSQMRTVFFDSSDLRSIGSSQQALAHQLRRGLAGDVDSPVATAVDLTAARAEGDPTQRAIADLVTRMDDLAAEVRFAVEGVTQEHSSGVRDRVRDWLSLATGSSTDAGAQTAEVTVEPGAPPIVRGKGELDLYAGPRFKSAVAEASDQGRRDVVVDLTEATFIDATALGVLVGAVRAGRDHRRRVAIAVQDATLKKVFDLTGIDRLVVMADSPAEAVELLRRARPTA